VQSGYKELIIFSNANHVNLYYKTDEMPPNKMGLTWSKGETK